MRKNNKLFALSILFLFSIATISCGGSGGGSTGSGDTTTGTINACETTGINQVFTSSFALSSSSLKNISGKASASTGDTITSSVLSFIGDSGVNEPVIFTTSTGKDVILTITKLQQIKQGFISIVFDAIIEVEIDTDGITEIQRSSVTGKKAIIDIATGKFYDLSSYDIDNSIIDGDNLYITKEGTVYKISFSNITIATPLNNATYNRVGKLLFKTNNNKIITYYENPTGTNGNANYSIDIAGIIPPKIIKSTSLTPAESTFSFVSSPYEISIAKSNYNRYLIDNSGNIWGYEIWGQRISGGQPNGLTAIFQISIDDNGQTLVSNYSEQSLSFVFTYIETYNQNKDDFYNERLYICDNGFVFFRVKPTGGIEFESSSFTRPSYGEFDIILNNNFLYWCEDTKIMRTELKTSNTMETVYNNSNLVTPYKMDIIGTNIIFYQYITALNVGTYNLQIGSSTPVLMSENKAEIMNILELTL